MSVDVEGTHSCRPQVTFASPNTEALTLLRDGLNRALLSHKPSAPAGGGAPPRRPLAPRCANTLHALQQQARAGAGAKPAASGPRPASSSASGASVTTLRPSASSRASLMGSCTFRVGGAPQPAASTADSRRSAGSMGSVEDLAPLSGEQARALELVKGGKNIFFTGNLQFLCK